MCQALGRFQSEKALVGPPVYHYDYGGYVYHDADDWDDALIAGGIILGGAVILDEIFEDDDWDDWDIDDDIDWDQGDITIYLGDSGDGFTMPFKEKWRAPDAIAGVAGFIITAALVTANLNSGHAGTILAAGFVLTVAAVWLLSKLPTSRPSTATRLVWMLENLRSQVSSSHPRRR